MKFVYIFMAMSTTSRGNPRSSIMVSSLTQLIEMKAL